MLLLQLILSIIKWFPRIYIYIFSNFEDNLFKKPTDILSASISIFINADSLCGCIRLRMIACFPLISVKDKQQIVQPNIQKYLLAVWQNYIFFLNYTENCKILVTKFLP